MKLALVDVQKRYGGLFREENLFSQREWLYLQKIG